MEEIIRGFIINELKIEPEYKGEPRLTLINHDIVYKVQIVFSLPVDEAKMTIQRVFDSLVYYDFELVYDRQGIQRVFRIAPNLDYSELLSFFEIVGRFKREAVMKQSYEVAAEMRDYEKEIEQILINRNKKA